MAGLDVALGVSEGKMSGVEEVAVRPRFARYRTEPSRAYREFERQRRQHWNL